jgi:hypothetical protein
MTALGTAVAAGDLGWKQLDLFAEDFYPTLAAKLTESFPELKLEVDLWRDVGFRETVANSLSVRDGDFYFLDSYLPFLHFQGWTKVFIGPKLFH